MNVSGGNDPTDTTPEPSMSRRSYQPTPDMTPEQRSDLAFSCGEDLHPKSPLARWIDTAPDSQELIESYHAGQSKRYENEGW